MQVSHLTARIANLVINELLPPLVRDCRWCMYPLFRLAFGGRATLFMDFRTRAASLDEAAFTGVYRDTADCHLKVDTDINPQCLQRILQERQGERVLEVGCGRGQLLAALHRQAPGLQLSGTDILRDAAINGMPWLHFVPGMAERLPFPERRFDTVICSHVLEHVRDPGAVLRELRRVCARRLIIVVPRERPYRFGFNLHLHFFPYAYSVAHGIAVGATGRVRFGLEGGDWFYTEDMV